MRDLLPLMGDFGLTLAARLRGEDYARRVQLVVEYDPQPPFGAGSPERAGETLVGEIRQRRAPLIAAAQAAANRARARLGISSGLRTWVGA